MKNIIFVFAVSFCAMFVANVALATAPEGDTTEEFDSDMSAPHTVFTKLEPDTEDGANMGIAGVTYVNRAVNSAGAAAMAAEAHAAAAGAYAVSAKASAEDAATAAGNAQIAADEAKEALDGKQPNLTDAQLAAVNSGINATKVSAYDGYATTISGKQATLTTENVVTDGTGNVVTAVTAADGTVTVTKGTTLGGLATKSAVASGDITDETIETADIKNGAVTAVKTTGIIGKVPSGSENSTDLASIWVQ